MSVASPSLTITSGEFDTDDGITMQVAGEPHPRVRITPQGTVSAGDGTAPPADISPAVGSSEIPESNLVYTVSEAGRAATYTVVITAESPDEVEIHLPDPTTSPDLKVIVAVGSGILSDFASFSFTTEGPGTVVIAGTPALDTNSNGFFLWPFGVYWIGIPAVPATA